VLGLPIVIAGGGSALGVVDGQAGGQYCHGAATNQRGTDKKYHYSTIARCGAAPFLARRPAPGAPLSLSFVSSSFSVTGERALVPVELSTGCRGCSCARGFSKKIVYSRPPTFGSKNCCVDLSGPPLGLNDYNIECPWHMPPSLRRNWPMGKGSPLSST
jgi:hypothetical protein